jgi:hypothetical protein
VSQSRWAGCFAPPAAGTCERSCGVQGECERGAARPACGRPPGLPAGRHQAGPAAVTEGDNSQGAMAVRGAQIAADSARSWRCVSGMTIARR